MTQRVNPNFAGLLGMDAPPTSEEEEQEHPLVTVDAHEITVVDNPNLPDMSDIDEKMLEGEKQLEILIDRGLRMTRELYSDLSTIEPKYRNRHMEVTSMIMATALDAIRHKTELQLKKKEQRLKEKSFGGKPDSDSPKDSDTGFKTREELMEFIRATKRQE